MVQERYGLVDSVKYGMVMDALRIRKVLKKAEDG
jgi:hypothetical protein